MKLFLFLFIPKIKLISHLVQFIHSLVSGQYLGIFGCVWSDREYTVLHYTTVRTSFQNITTQNHNNILAKYWELSWVKQIVQICPGKSLTASLHQSYAVLYDRQSIPPITIKPAQTGRRSRNVGRLLQWSGCYIPCLASWLSKKFECGLYTFEIEKNNHRYHNIAGDTPQTIAHNSKIISQNAPSVGSRTQMRMLACCHGQE